MMLPAEFEKQMSDILSDGYGSFKQSYEEPHFSALRRNKRKISENDLADIFGVSAKEISDSAVLWEQAGHYYIDAENGGNSRETSLVLNHPGKSPFHEAGLYYIQEPSAMLPVRLLDVDDSGMRVLDLCAAPGGKTTQIADAMCGKGILIANEIMPNRAKILSENIERMGVANAIVISADPRDIADRFAGFFDRILVDAPCSGEGMFRKHPEAMGEWSLENVNICADRQSWILDCAANMLRPGGKLVYSTCTFNRAEDEDSVNAFLDRHSDFTLAGEMHRIFPHLHKGEGHFAAAFLKENAEYNKKYVPEKSLRRDSYSLFMDFVKDYITKEGQMRLFNGKSNDKDCEGIFIMFGNQLYLAPKDTPVLKNLKVLRPGLHLGTIEKSRFEPSHALALFLRKQDAVNVCNLNDEENARRYIKGETLSCDGKKGWTLVCVKGYSLGWGKTSNGTLKNHYPKGLRK